MKKNHFFKLHLFYQNFGSIGAINKCMQQNKRSTKTVEMCDEWNMSSSKHGFNEGVPQIVRNRCWRVVAQLEDGLEDGQFGGSCFQS